MPGNIMRLRLSQRGLLLVSLPLIWQLTLVCGLYLVNQATQQYMERCESTAEITRIAAQWAVANSALSTRLDMSLQSGLPIDQHCLGYLGQMELICQKMKDVELGHADFMAHRNSLWRTVSETVDRVDFPEFRNGQIRMAPARGKTNKPAAPLGHYLTLSTATRQIADSIADLQRNLTSTSAPAETRQRKLLQFEYRQPSRDYSIGIGEHPDGHQSFVFSSAYRLNERICWTVLLIVASVINLLLLVSLGWFFNYHIVKRLAIMQENSLRMAKGLELQPALPGSDEIAQVDQAFHSMAEAIEEATRFQRGMMENAGDLICFLDGNGRILAANPAAADMIGYRPDELVNIWLADLVVSNDQEVLAQKLLDAIEGDVPPFEIQLKGRNGSTVDTLWSVRWSESEGTSLCVVHDISAKKAAQRLQTEVVQMVGHDLRSPLFSISGFHEMLEQGMLGKLSSQAEQLLAAAQRSTTRMLQLINDLLDIERIDSQKLILNKTTIDLSKLFDEAVAVVAQSAANKSVHIEKQTTSLQIFADEQRLLQILVNLLSNAIKFTPPGNGVLLSAEKGYGSVRVNVADTGRGIPADKIAHVFERFVQLTAGDSKVERGTGLGLTICKALVELHGGDIRVASSEATGTTFTFGIPDPDESVEPTLESFSKGAPTC
jgi:PAS domain S-box-containing protein